jgi:hypothetical protein
MRRARAPPESGRAIVAVVVDVGLVMEASMP